MRASLALAAYIALAVPAGARAKPPTLQDAIGDPEDFKLSGSIRLRYEALEGQPRTGLRDPDEQLALRTIVSAEYDPGPVRVFAELHDSRAWLYRQGSPVGPNEVNTAELVQAFVGKTFDAPFVHIQERQLSELRGRLSLDRGKA